MWVLSYSSLVLILLSSSTLVYLFVPSLVCRVPPLVLPAHHVYRQLGTSRVQTNPTALTSRNVPDNVMSPKVKKATATAAKASKERSPLVTTGRTSLRSPIDDGARSQMFNLSSDRFNSRPLPARRRSGGNEPLMSLDLDTPPKRRKQRGLSNKEDSPSASLHASGDPNLGIRLEDAVETRAQQSQNRVRDEQTPVKERFELPHSAKESPDSSSAADDLITKEGPDSSSAADDSITKEGPDSSSVGGDNTETSLSIQKSDSAHSPKPLSSKET